MKIPAPIEPLEARISPAVILTFTDGVDNDTVKLISDKPLTAVVSFAANGSPSAITIAGAGLDGASLTTVVTKSANGDGFVNIGRIVATGLDLGAVSVKGDLGAIICGNNASPLPALKSLTVRSMGVFGTATSGLSALNSEFIGDVGAISIAGDAIGARLNILGNVGTVKIGGDLRGADSSGSGRINAVNAASITIGGDLVAGEGDESGKLVFTGNLGKLSIGGDLFGAIDATGDPLSGQITVFGDAGPISIRGDIFGAVSEEKAIDVRGDAGPITIRGSIFGGGAMNTGAIAVVGNAGPIIIGGSMTGGGGVNSGGIDIGGNAGAITLRGSIVGGAGVESGSIEVAGKVGAIKVGGSVINGGGRASGSILIAGSGAGLSIVGDVRGGAGGTDFIPGAQIIFSGNCLGPVKIGGSIIGSPSIGGGNVAVGKASSVFVGGSIIGDGIYISPQLVSFPSGFLGFGDVPVVTIVGDIVESPFGGGFVQGGDVKKFTLGGSIVGASTLDPLVTFGSLLSLGNVGVAKIDGGILGSTAAGSRDISFKIGGNVGTLTVTGSLLGGNTALGGSISIGGNAGSVKIAGSLTGGLGSSTAMLRVGGTLSSVTIGGSVTALAEYGAFLGQIVAANIGSVKIAGDLLTGGGTDPSRLRATGDIGSVQIGGTMASIIDAKNTGPVKIGGDLRAPGGMVFAAISGQSLASLVVGGDVYPAASGKGVAVNLATTCGPITIGGDLRGIDGTPVRIIAGGTPGTVNALASLQVKGSVSQAEILAGWEFALISKNEDATIGPVKVGRDWTASTLIASAKPGADMKFGTSDDTPTGTTTPALSRIASITIKGQVLGTATAGDHFGFVAQSIGPVKVGGVAYTPIATPIELGLIFDDVTVRLV